MLSAYKPLVLLVKCCMDYMHLETFSHQVPLLGKHLIVLYILHMACMVITSLCHPD